MAEKKKVSVGNEKAALTRPAWTQDDLHAYKHKHPKKDEEFIENYYVKSRGWI